MPACVAVVTIQKLSGLGSKAVFAETRLAGRLRFRKADVSGQRWSACLSRSEAANRSAVEMKRIDSACVTPAPILPSCRCFARRVKPDFEKSKKCNVDNGPATVHGVVFAVFDVQS
jgi:hypothetical protein